MSKMMLLILVSGLTVFTGMAQVKNYGNPVPDPDASWTMGEYIGDYSEFSVKERKLINKGYIFFNGVGLGQGSNKLFGLVDQNEKWVVPPIYDAIKAPFIFAIMPARKKTKWGVIDKDGELIVPFLYDEIELNGESSLNMMMMARLNGKWGELDKWGKKIVKDFLYEEYQWLDSENSNLLLAKMNGKWGMADNWGGNTIIPFLYDTIQLSDSNGEQIIATIKNKDVTFDKSGIPQTGMATAAKEMPVKKQEPAITDTKLEAIKAPPKNTEPVVTNEAQKSAPTNARDVNMEQKISRFWQAYLFNDGSGWKTWTEDFGTMYQYFFFHFRSNNKFTEYDGTDGDDGTWKYDPATKSLQTTIKGEEDAYIDTFFVKSVSESEMELTGTSGTGGIRFKAITTPAFIPNPKTASDLTYNLSLSKSEVFAHFKLFGAKSVKNSKNGDVRATEFEYDKTVTYIDDDVCGYSTELSVDAYKTILAGLKSRGFTEYKSNVEGVDKSLKSGRYAVSFYNVGGNEAFLGLIHDIFVKIIDTDVLKIN
ncbi:MAG: WG repeat-containing protein [Bacteroidota bacterium]